MSERSRTGLTLIGALAAVIGTGIALYWGYHKLTQSSISPAVSPTVAISTASGSRPNQLNFVSPAEPTTTSASDSTNKLAVPKVQLDYTLEGGSSSVNSLAISRDGQTLVSSSDYTNVKVWNLGKGCTGTACSTPTRTLPMYSPWIYSIAISPDSQVVAGGSWQDIKLWNLNTGELRREISGHFGAVYAVAIAANGQTLASGGSDDKIKIWNLSSGKLLHSLSGHSDSVRSLAITPNGQTLVSGSSDKTIKMWNLGSGCTGETCITPTKTLSGHKEFVSTLMISPDGKTLVSGSADKSIKIWNLQTGKRNRTLFGHSGTVLSVSISPDGKVLASGSADGTIKLWWLDTGELLNTISGHSDMVNSVAFSPNGRKLISSSSDKKIKIWQLL